MITNERTHPHPHPHPETARTREMRARSTIENQVYSLSQLRDTWHRKQLKPLRLTVDVVVSDQTLNHLLQVQWKHGLPLCITGIFTLRFVY